jgi:hypothetical protein
MTRRGAASRRGSKGGSRWAACLALTPALLCGGFETLAHAQESQPKEVLPSTWQAAGDRAREEAAARRNDGENGTRLRLFLDDTLLSPTLPARVAFGAALDQRGREPAEWGRGADDFGKRLAVRAGRTLAQSGVQHATAALLSVDPRGERASCGCAHPLRRTAHALAKTFVTRDRRGRVVPNVPLFAGAYGGALIATAWYPPSYHRGQDAMRAIGVTVGAQAGANVFREFSPDLKRLVTREKSDRQ